MSRHLLPLVFLFATPMLQADVLVVDHAGGGDFTTLSAAVAAAADGDTLLVRDGNYIEAAQTVINGKALTIAGEWATSVHGVAVTIQPGFTIRNLPPGKLMVLQNLTIHGTPGTVSAAATPALTLRDNLSPVRVQSCILFGGGGGHNNAPDGVAAVDVANSISTALVGSLVLGGDGQFSPDLSKVTGDGGPGLSLAIGQVLVSESSVQGGSGGSNNVGGWPDGGTGGTGIAHFGGYLMLVGSYVSGSSGGTAHHGGDGGTGISMNGTGLAWLLGGSFANGGQGGWSDSGPDGATGPGLSDPSGVVTSFGGSFHAFDLTSPLREGEVGTLDFGGDASDTVLVFASLANHQIPYVAYQGVLLLAPTALIGPFAIGAPGNQDLHFTAPALPAGIEALRVHVQPAYVGSDGVVFGTGRVLTLLDAAF